MHALIDADGLVYRYGFAAQKKDKDKDVLIVEPERNVITALSIGIAAMLRDTNAREYTMYLSGSRNFRVDMYPDYKAQRKDFEKPYHYDNIRNYFIQCHDAVVTNGIEADDALVIEQLKDPDNNCIVTVDKDLDQVEGFHYNPVKGQLYYVTPEEGWYNFYMQMLTGDTVDNIKGIKGIGPKKAEKILEPAESIQDLHDRCIAEYAKAFPDFWEAEWEKNWVLLRMLRVAPEDNGYPSAQHLLSGEVIACES